MKTVEKIYQEHLCNQREVANNLLTETLIDKFSTLLKYINMVDSSDNLREELNSISWFA